MRKQYYAHAEGQNSIIIEKYKYLGFITLEMFKVYKVETLIYIARFWRFGNFTIDYIYYITSSKRSIEVKYEKDF